MNICGIIAEYNPFHNGHFYHLTEAKSLSKADGIICIMSGNFVQRGEIALIDKWTRSKIAVDNGIDLVLELPTFYSLSSAELFAKGSIETLNNLNVVNNIVFGSECGDISILKELAIIIAKEPIEYKQKLKEFLDLGLLFPKARAQALETLIHNKEIKEILSSSNNILSLEYLKALIRSDSSIEPITLTREGGSYNSNSLHNKFSSATSIRKTLLKNSNIDLIKDHIPEETFRIFEQLNSDGYKLQNNEELFSFIKYKLVTDCTFFNNLLDVSEGLDNKIIKEIHNSKSLDDFITKIKSKRYTYTRISRILCQIFIGIDQYNSKKLLETPIDYCRVLGFNNKGREILKRIKKNSDINIITKVPKHIDNPHLAIDLKGTKAYSLINKQINWNDDYLRGPYYKQNT